MYILMYRFAFADKQIIWIVLFSLYSTITNAPQFIPCRLYQVYHWRHMYKGAFTLNLNVTPLKGEVCSCLMR